MKGEEGVRVRENEMEKYENKKRGKEQVGRGKN